MKKKVKEMLKKLKRKKKNIMMRNKVSEDGRS